MLKHKGHNREDSSNLSYIDNSGPTYTLKITLSGEEEYIISDSSNEAAIELIPGPEGEQPVIEPYTDLSCQPH